MSENITITIGGQRFGGWRSGEIRSSIETLSDSFTLQGWNMFGTDNPIIADEECIIEVSGEPVITGYIDSLSISTDGKMIIQGRDKTRDLIDCQSPTTSFLNQSVLSIVQSMSAPFGITATGDTGATVKQFVIAQDETCADAMKRLLTNYGMIITSDESGNVVVRSPGDFDNPGLAIREGVNIKKATGVFRANSRFSAVKVFGQNALSPGFSSQVIGDSPWIRPKRVFLADDVNQSDTALAATRIRDYTNGAACSVNCEITTLDYVPAGTEIFFESEEIGIEGQMIVESVALSFDDSESSVKFNLVSPEKYGGNKLDCRYLK